MFSSIEKEQHELSDPGMEGIPEVYREMRPAGHYRRQHGNRVLSAGRSRDRRCNLLLHRPRQRQDHEPDPGEEKIPRQRAAAADGSSRESTCAPLPTPGLAEEAGAAYKNIDDVVDAAEQAGLSRRVVRLVPIGSIKG